jgi:hypothetical protein
MKCPLITAGFWADPGTGGKDAIDCLKEECAWWDMVDKSCVIFRMSRTLLAVEKRLKGIESLIPYGQKGT